MQIAIALITLALCGGFLFWFKRSEEKKKIRRSSEEDEERKAEAQKTAQDFVNAKDLGKNCLYTADGMIFAYIKIEGLCLELYSRAEQKALCQRLSSAISQIKRPFKFIAVPRPADVSKSLQVCQELYSVAEGGRKALLKNDISELADMAISGETLERQYYLAIWDTIQKVDENIIISVAQEIEKKFNENGVQADLLDRKGIVRLCNLVNIPAYVHIESADIEDVIAVLSDG